jgi:peptidylprolyl isomerase
MIATLAASALLLAPVPAAQAFVLPRERRCVSTRALALKVRALDGGWRSVTVQVDGRRVKRVIRPSPKRAIRLRDLPAARFALRVDARARDGRRASATRTYHPCPPAAEPAITIPEGPPPTRLVTRDLIDGTGARARTGMTASLRYTLTAWSTRRTVDSSWSRRERFTYELGAGFVIEGLDRGVQGMRVGGRRELILPPAFGYGEMGAPPTIRPNETLVFVVDLVEVRG